MISFDNDWPKSLRLSSKKNYTGFKIRKTRKGLRGRIEGTGRNNNREIREIEAGKSWTSFVLLRTIYYSREEDRKKKVRKQVELKWRDSKITAVVWKGKGNPWKTHLFQDCESHEEWVMAWDLQENKKEESIMKQGRQTIQGREVTSTTYAQEFLRTRTWEVSWFGVQGYGWWMEENSKA